jgi:hypothetical protein
MREAEVKRNGEVREDRVGEESYGSEAFPWIFFLVRVATFSGVWVSESGIIKMDLCGRCWHLKKPIWPTILQ